MAKFYNGSGVSAVLTEIITNADEQLFIISPYLKIPIQTKNYLRSADDKNFTFTIIYRTDSSLSADDIRYFNELKNLDLRCCDNLHTKCYINEKEGLITSMNLHEHSQISNWEMGIKFTRRNDLELYTDVVKELNYIIKASKPYSPQQKNQEMKQSNSPYRTSQKSVYKPKEAPGVFTQLLDSFLGKESYCIRCGHFMGYHNFNKPLCSVCYPTWAQFKKKDYPESHCHGCGKLKPNISFEKPFCRECYDNLHK